MKATWFVTHDSPAINALRDHPDLFELGIHPNFSPSSTQGQTPKGIIEHCMSIVPEARSVKSHALLESTHLLEVIMKHSPVGVDLTTLLPGFCLKKPVAYEWKKRFLWKISCCWEDNFQFCCHKPLWRIANMKWLSEGGIAAFTFHPIHIALNSCRYEQYEALKGCGSFASLNQSDVDKYRNGSLGTHNIFTELVQFAAKNGNGVRIQDVICDHS